MIARGAAAIPRSPRNYRHRYRESSSPVRLHPTRNTFIGSNALVTCAPTGKWRICMRLDEPESSLRLKQNPAVPLSKMSSHALRKAARFESRARERKLMAALRKEGSSNLTEDGSEEERYLPLRSRVNKRELTRLFATLRRPRLALYRVGARFFWLSIAGIFNRPRRCDISFAASSIGELENANCGTERESALLWILTDSASLRDVDVGDKAASRNAQRYHSRMSVGEFAPSILFFL